MVPKPKIHIWPFEGTAHPVEEKHEEAPKGSSHWNEGPVQFNIPDEKYDEGK